MGKPAGFTGTNINRTSRSGGADDVYDEYEDGQNVPISAAGRARVRYNNVTKLQEISIDGGPYVPFAIGSEVLLYNGFTNRTDSQIAFDNALLQFTIQPLAPATEFTFYNQGQKFVKNAPEQVNINNIEGLWFIYYSTGGVLTASQTPWSFDIQTFIAYLYWDATAGASLVFADERHGAVMDWKTHEYLHLTVNTRFYRGLGVDGDINGDGSLDAHAEIAVADGDVYDEDLLIDIRNAAVPANPYEQVLSPIAQIPVYYYQGATPVVRKKIANTFPLLEGVNRIQWNQFLAGAWSTVEAANNGKFIAMWLFATNDIDEPVVAVLGQRSDGTLGAAQDSNTPEDLVLTGLAFQEAKLIFRLIFQTSTAYANAPSARLRDITDYRAAQGTPSGAYVPTPPTALPYGFISGLQLSNNAANPLSQVDIGIGRCRDRLNSEDIEVSSALTANITVAGAGGLDTGVEAANTWYYAYVIKNPSTGVVAALLSADPNTPILPAGYTAYRRVGSVRNNASSNFLRFRQNGFGQDRTYLYFETYTATSVIVNGAATIGAPALVSCASFIPPTSRKGTFLGVESGVGGQQFVVNPGDLVIGVGSLWGIFGQTQSFEMFECDTDSSQQIWYAGTGGPPQVSIYVKGYEEALR